MSGSGSTRYRGVRKRKWGKWVSEIRERQRRPESRSNRIWLGSFRSAEEAAHAYDAALLCCRPRTAANLNFPNFNYRLPPGTTGRYSIQEIQAAAAAAAAQYAGRAFSYSSFRSPTADSSSSGDDEDATPDITHDETSVADPAAAGPSSPQQQQHHHHHSWAGGDNWSPYDDPALQESAPPPPNSDDDDDEDDSDDDSDDDDEPRLWP